MLATVPNSGIPAGLRTKAFDDVSGATGHAAGILHVAPDGDVLLCRRSGNEQNYGGYWSLPGGGVEDGETPEEGARREIDEELGGFHGSKLRLLDRRQTSTGKAFHTFAAPVDKKFHPTLNDEHVGYAWFPLDNLPEQIHPGVQATLKDRLGVGGEDMKPEDWAGLRDGFLKWTAEEEAEPEHATDSALVLALDKESVREVDQDGRLRIERAHISKANVCPYRGAEIPSWEELGLERDKIYELFRDPEELRKAAKSSNGVQLLKKHVPVNADDPQQWDVVGATGTDGEFVDPYLDNSLVVWVKEAIDGIESDAKKQLSMGYHYRADMTAGNFGGKHFDGVMRDIVVNHVALVEQGRAGTDVVVGDSMEGLMTKPTRIARLALGLTARAVNPLLAFDAKIDYLPIFRSVTSKTFDAKKLSAAIGAAIKGKTIAKDATIDHVTSMLDKLEHAAKEDPKSADESVSEEQHKAMEAAAHGESNLDIPKKVGEEFVKKDEDLDDAGFDAEPLKAYLREQGMSDDAIAKACDMMPKAGARDEDPEEKAKREAEEKKAAEEKAASDKKARDESMKNSVTKDELDATLKAALASNANEIRKSERDIRIALDEVRPYIGDLPATLAFDSGAAVRRHALKTLQVEGAETIHESALSTILKMQPKAGAHSAAPARRVAMDAAGAKNFKERFPEADRISQV